MRRDGTTGGEMREDETSRGDAQDHKLTDMCRAHTGGTPLSRLLVTEYTSQVKAKATVEHILPQCVFRVGGLVISAPAPPDSMLFLFVVPFGGGRFRGINFASAQTELYRSGDPQAKRITIEIGGRGADNVIERGAGSRVHP